MSIETTLDRAPDPTDAVTEALSIRIDSPQSYERATEVLKGLRQLDREIRDFFDPLKRSAQATVDLLRGKEKEKRGPISRAVAALSSGLSGWEREVDRLRLEAEAKARREAEAMERERLDRAAALEDAGMTREAEKVLDAPAPPPQPSFPTEILTPSAEGVSYRTTTTITIVDPSKLDPQWILREVSDTPVKKLDESWLGQALRRLAKAHGSNLGKVVGEGAVEVSEKKTRVVR